MSTTDTLPPEKPDEAKSGGGVVLQRLVGRHSWALLINADCLDVREQLQADAIISDPPYGMNLNTDNSRFSGGNIASVSKRGNGIGTGGGEGIIGDDKPFDPSPWLKYPRAVLFGCNHYAERLPVGTTLVWLKRHDGGFGSFLSDAELAWMKGGCGVYVKRDLSMNGETLTRCHPCQKPVPLMAWCIEMAKVPEGGTVCDPYMGSGSTGVACVRLHRNFIGVEKDKRHFDNACDRIRRELEGALL